MTDISTHYCIVGGGPAGMMLGFLLARSGIEVVVLEKWPDFFRDFRGDTIHPSTLEVLYELNLLDDFLKLPHDETKQLAAEIGPYKVILADFSQLKVRCPFIAFLPQWDFLNFIAKQAQSLPTFKLLMETEATDLIYENNRVTGVRAKNASTEFAIKADLIIGADGRHSLVREKSGLPLQVLGAPMDVLWFRLSRISTDPKQTMGKIEMGNMLVMIERGDYWQCGFIIRKGKFEAIEKLGLESFRANLTKIVPWLKDRTEELQSWDQIKMLTVTVDRLSRWYKEGLLCIGDAAHAMSPIGGVGINLAIQDAVATANILVPLENIRLPNQNDLQMIQNRRELPTKLTQKLQVFIQSRVIDKVLGNTSNQTRLPFLLKLLQWFPYLRRFPAYLVGMGFRPEHIKFPLKKN